MQSPIGDVCARWLLSREQSSAGWGADRTRGVSIGVAQANRSEPLQIWRSIARLKEGGLRGKGNAGVLPSKIVDQNQNDIGRLGDRCMLRRRLACGEQTADS